MSVVLELPEGRQVCISAGGFHGECPCGWLGDIRHGRHAARQDAEAHQCAVPDDRPAPECPHGHGPMVPRSLAGMSREAAWCGTWYDCPPGPSAYHCASSALVPSPELTAQLDTQKSGATA